MNVRLPKGAGGFGSGLSGIKDMAMKAQKMQEEMEALTSQLNEKEYSFTYGSGTVTISIKGNLQVTGITINPDIVDKDDLEMLQDIIAAAINGAITVVNKDKDEQMNQLSEKIGLPSDMPSSLPGLF